MIEFIWDVLSDGYFWLGIVPGAFIGAWLVTQNGDYRRFQEAERKAEQDALFKKYTYDD